MANIKTISSRLIKRTQHIAQWVDRVAKQAVITVWGSIFRIGGKYAKRWLSPFGRLSVQHYRVSAGVMALLMIASILVPVLSIWTTNRSYDLTPQTRALLGETNTNLLEKLTFDPAQNLYQFNKDAKKAPTTDGNPIEQLQNQVGGAGKEDEQLYSVDVSRDINKGVTYYDNQMQLSFKVTPQFETRPGEKKEGHLIYPLLGTKGQLAYTVTAGGLKENLILQESPGDSFVMDYKLELPDSLEAKLLETGEVGVYAADPALFGQITYGSSDDQARVEEARTKSPKTHLAFVIPAPVVLGVGQEDQSVVAPVKSQFELKGTSLRVRTTGLDKAEYPLSIDPTVSITSNSDFATGNFEDNNLDVDGDSLRRSGLSGGSVNLGNSTTAFTTGRSGHTTMAYNGYLYVLGGLGGGGSGSQTFNFTGGAQSFLVPAGVTSISVDARGARGGGNGGNGGRVQATLAVTPGETLNIYVGGQNGYNGGGAAGSATGGGASDIRRGGTALGNRVIVAGGGGARGGGGTCNIYLQGGIGGGTTGGDGVSSSGQNEGGKGGTQLAGGSGGSSGGSSGSLGVGGAGYSDITGGGGGGYYGGGSGGGSLPGNQLRCGGGGGGSSYAGSGTSGVTHTQGFQASDGQVIISYTIPAGVMNNVQYAPINPDGTLGWWITTSSFPTGRRHHTSAVYNGYMYVMGGWDNGSNYYSDVQKAKINSDGSIGEWSATTGLPSGRRSHSSVAYNGYIYSLGGSTGSGVFTNNTLYAPLRADGTIGSWTSTTNLPTNLHAQTSVSYNGYIYIIGGHTGSSGVNSVHYAPLNADGTIGSWTATESFPGAGRWAHASVVYKGYVYVLGGYNGAASADTYFAPIYGDGRLGPWQAMPSLLVAADYPAAAAYNGRIYFTGGYNNTNSYMNNVRYGAPDQAGGVTSWSATTTLSSARRAHAMVAYNGRMYVLGGGTIDTGGAINTVQYATINANGTLGSWSATTNLSSARYAHTAFAHNGYMYVLGGYTGSAALNNVQRATINANGTLGSWSNMTNLTSARYEHNSVVFNNRVYVLGGYTGSTVLNNVQYATIAANGNLGSWTTVTNLPVALYAHASVVYGSRIYVFGGRTPSTSFTDTVYYTTIAANGTLGSWSTTTSLPAVNIGHKAVVLNGYVYVSGGWNGTRLATVIKAPFNSDGTIGSWSNEASLSVGRSSHGIDVYKGRIYTSGGSNPTATTINETVIGIVSNGGGGDLGSFANTTSLSSFNAYARSVAHNGYLYVIGGHDAVTSADRNTVSYAPINKNGTLGAWSTTSNMTKPRSSPGVTIANGYIYAAGGYSTTDYLNDIEYAKINADGTIGDWALSGTFPHKRDSSGLHAYNNRLYLIGGWGYDGVDWGGMNYVHSAPINSNGTVGSWTAENSFNTRRGESTTALNNGYLYVMGGQSFDYNSVYNDVQYAKINGDGTVGTWAYTSGFNVGRYGHTASVANGYMYITGGHNNSSNLVDVQYAAINADGTLGDWQQTSLYSIQRRRHAQVIYDGYLYMLGGDKGYSNADCRSSTSGQYCDSVQYAPINAIARKATYSKMIDLATESSIIDIAYTGTLHGGSAEVSYRSAGSDGVFGSKQSLASFTPSQPCDAESATARYIQLFVTLDDKDNGAFRDALGQNGAVLDSLTVTTDPGRAPPDKRMRHGKWFSEQTQRPYDTCQTGEEESEPEELEYRGWSSDIASDAPGPLTVNLPANSQGYVAVVTYNTYDSTNSFVAPSGWTEVTSDTYAGCSPAANCRTVTYVANTTTPGTTWNWTGDALVSVGVAGYSVPVEVHASGGSVYTAVAPSVNVSQPSLVLHAVGDLNDSNAAITYPVGAAIGQNQSIGWNAVFGYSASVAVAHQEVASGATGTATFTVPASWQPRAYTLALIAAD